LPLEPPFPREDNLVSEESWEFTVEQYEERILAGILTEDDPLELLDGWLVPKMPERPPHVLATELVRDALGKTLREGWHVNSQQPIRLSTSEPEPDAVVVRGNRRDYRDRLPGPEDVALVVEVAETSLEQDRTFKKAIYARAEIPVYWIIDLVERQVEVFHSPNAAGATIEYATHRVYGPDDELPLVVAGDELGRIAVRELLP
jgi:Uma2 family endonuclease